MHLGMIWLRLGCLDLCMGHAGLELARMRLSGDLNEWHKFEECKEHLE
jgi:hypothetical protein